MDVLLRILKPVAELTGEAYVHEVYVEKQPKNNHHQLLSVMMKRNTKQKKTNSEVKS